MVKFNLCFTGTILIFTSILIADASINDAAAKNVTLVPHLFPQNATKYLPFQIIAQTCWPNMSELWFNFMHSHSKSNIPQELGERSHFKMISESFQHHIMQIVAHIGEIIDLLDENKTQKEIPEAATAAGNASQSIPPIYPFQVPLCWINISSAYRSRNLHSPVNVTRLEIRRLRSRFSELSQNFTSQIIQIITTVEEINNLTNPYVTKLIVNREQLLQPDKPNISEKKIVSEVGNETQKASTNNLEKIVENESFLKSAIVPILLMIILVQFVCVAILYRKLHLERFKDVPILLEDEIMNRFVNAQNTG